MDSDTPGEPEDPVRSAFVVVSNRLPVDRVTEPDGSVRWRTSPGGLVTAMEPVVRDLGCVWVGWPGSIDEQLEPFAVGAMRLLPVSLSAADPLNLVGILTPGARLPALSGNRVLYRDGVPLALFAGGEVSFLAELAPQEQWEARNLLLRRHVPAVLADLA